MHFAMKCWTHMHTSKVLVIRLVYQKFLTFHLKLYCLAVLTWCQLFIAPESPGAKMSPTGSHKQGRATRCIRFHQTLPSALPHCHTTAWIAFVSCELFKGEDLGNGAESILGPKGAQEHVLTPNSNKYQVCVLSLHSRWNINPANTPEIKVALCL